MTASQHIGIFLFADVEELDAIGPWEVLSFWTTHWPQDGWRVFTFSHAGGEVRCAKGLTVRADHSEADRPDLDVLVYPGGQGTRTTSTTGPASTGFVGNATTAPS